MTTLSILLLFLVALLSVACPFLEKDVPLPTADCTILDNLQDLVLENLSGPIKTSPSSSKISVLFQVYEKASGNPVAGLKQEDFIIWERPQGSDCFENKSGNSETNQVIRVDPQRFKHSTMLVLDLSKSVTSNYLNELKEASKNFISTVMPDPGSPSYTMGIWWFDGTNQFNQLVNFTSNKSELVNSIDKITAQLAKDNSTDLYGTVVRASTVAADRVKEFTQQKIISGAAVVFFTDGNDEANRSTKQDALNAISSTQKISKSIKFLSVGIGPTTNLRDLKDFGYNGFFPAQEKSQLAEVFKQIAQLVFNFANSYYIFEYCSGKRNGIIELSIATSYKPGKKTLKGAMKPLTFSANGFMSCQ
jgi:uncharacterized protein YegL